MKPLFSRFMVIMLLMLFMGSTMPQTGTASFYGPESRGRPTASGERFYPSAMTAAHKSLPFGAWVRIQASGQSPRFVDVRINDRGPFIRGRELDLSPAAFKRLAPLSRGVVNVKYWRIK